jgi:hypothetical protein
VICRVDLPPDLTEDISRHPTELEDKVTTRPVYPEQFHIEAGGAVGEHRLGLLERVRDAGCVAQDNGHGDARLIPLPVRRLREAYNVLLHFTVQASLPYKQWNAPVHMHRSGCATAEF